MQNKNLSLHSKGLRLTIKNSILLDSMYYRKKRRIEKIRSMRDEVDYDFK